MTQSMYEQLGTVDSALRDKVMREMGVTREMVDSNMTVEEYLRVTGQTEQLEVLRAAASEQRGSTFVNRINSGYVAPAQNWQSPAGPEHRHDSHIYNMADSGKEWKVYENAHSAYTGLQAAIALHRVWKKRKHLKDIADGIDKVGDLTSLIGKAPSGLDDAISHAHGMADKAGDAGDLVSQAHHVGDAAARGAGAAADVGGLGLGVLFGIGTGFLLDAFIVGKTKERISNAYDAYCQADLKIAADYYTRNRTATDSLKSPPEKMTAAETAAFRNLWETMEFNGGCELFGRKIIRDLGTAAGVVGTVTAGPLGGLLAGTTVYTVVKTMESNQGVPSPYEIGENWKTGNFFGALITAGMAFAFPITLAATIPSMVALNMVSSKVKEETTRWHNTFGNDSSRSAFLFEIGKTAQQAVTRNPSTHTDEAIRIRMQADAEAAAKRISGGTGKHSIEDVRTLSRFAQIAPHYYQKPCEDETFPALKARFEATMKFIKDAKILENKATLINIARDQGMNR